MKLKLISLFVASTAALTSNSYAVVTTLIGIANTSIGLVTLDPDHTAPFGTGSVKPDTAPRTVVSGSAVFVSVTGGLIGGNEAIASSMNTLLSTTTSTFADFTSSLTTLIGVTDAATSPGVIANTTFTNGLFQFSQTNTQFGNAGNSTYMFLVALFGGNITGIGAYTGSAVPASGSVTFNPAFANDGPLVGTSVLAAAIVGPPAQPVSGFQLAAAVPEPSAALLGALGVLGLLRRRRI